MPCFAKVFFFLTKELNKTTAFDLEDLKQILDGKAERKDEGSKRKDRPTSKIR